jgi:type IV secretion system protein VirB9
VSRFVAVLVALLAGGSTLASVVPAVGAVDPRVREILYAPEQVVSLTGYVGYHIDLQLENGERFVALGAGDSAAVDVAAEGAHVLLKPKAARVATNLTLVSSRRVYHFEYRTNEAPPPLQTAIFALRFRYPVAPSEMAPAATPVAKVREPPRPLNADYWYCGSPWLQPQAVTDDGVQTRVTFSKRGEWPAIFVANADGTESLLNFHAEGTTAVLHRVAPRFVLRRGRLVGCIENRGYAGSGEWLGNGALDPNDRREVQP